MAVRKEKKKSFEKNIYIYIYTFDESPDPVRFTRFAILRERAALISDARVSQSRAALGFAVV